jgi:peptidoglycan/xylan/chitin deacetylase (PgdA/CDA1 family)
MGDVQRRLINLTFHGVGDPDPGLPADEAATWIGHDRFLAVLDAVAGRSDVRISFDDGNASDVEHALPALYSRGLHATFFVVAGRLGQPGFLGEADVRKLSTAGMIIGCHGMHHRPWRRLDDDQLREEMLDARGRLERVVERPVTEAACPFGAYDRHVLKVLRQCGYRHVFTSDRGTVRAEDWLQPRNTVHASDDAHLLERIARLERGPRRALTRRATLTAKRWR